MPQTFLETTSLTELRQRLHQQPELSNQEYQTTELIKNYLRELGITILPLPLETGVVAEIGTNDAGPIVGLRADIDALPIAEQTGLPYQSRNAGVSHACGHDFHTAALLGAARRLKADEGNLPGKVRLIFQPAEENFQGAQAVIQAGGLTDLSALFGFHNAPQLPKATFGLRESRLMASVDRFQITLKGRGTHAAKPHLGSDPIVTTGHIITALQTIVSRYISPADPALLSITHIEAGNTWNVIPETSLLEGTIRAFSPHVRQSLIDYLNRTVEQLAGIDHQTAEVTWLTGPDAVSNQSELYTIFAELLPQLAPVITPEPSLGGEDFTFYQREVPTFFCLIGTGSTHPLHHPAFLVDDEVLPLAVDYFVTGAKQLLEHYQ